MTKKHRITFFPAQNFPKKNNIKFIAFDFEILFGRSFSSLRLVASNLSPRESARRTFFLCCCWCHSSKQFYNFLLFCLRSAVILMLRWHAGSLRRFLSLCICERAEKCFNFFSVFMFAQIIPDGLSHAGWRNTPNTCCR